MTVTTPPGRPPRMAMAAVTAWTRLYTVLTPAAARRQRRDELASDLHDHWQDLRARHTSRAAASAEILRRMIAGMPDDLIWALTSFEEEHTMPRMRTLATTGWAIALVVSVLAMFMAVHDLAHGWRELAQHWWSALAAAGLLSALAGLGITLLTARSRPNAPTNSPD